MEARLGPSEPFKTCSYCGAVWPTREAYLADGNVKLIGYQALLDRLQLGLLLFNHLSCGTTQGIEAERFADLYNGPIFSERLTGSEDCPEYCLDRECLAPCPNQCACAWVREVLQVVAGWPKAA